MKPTPCEHEWQDEKYYPDCPSCKKCGQVVSKPTPEEKCMSREVCKHQRLVGDYCQACDRESYKSSPSPEARVDWEREADDIIEGFMADGGEVDGRWIKSSGSSLYERIAKALSAAFEKGREAR